MSSEISKKRTVSSEVIIETCSSEVHHEQIINANKSESNHFATESTKNESEDVSLQDFIDAEINSRLSNITIEATSNSTTVSEETNQHFTCMSNNINTDEICQLTTATAVSEPEPIIVTNTESETIIPNNEPELESEQIPVENNEILKSNKQDTHIFLENEKYFNSLQLELQDNINKEGEQLVDEETENLPPIVKINEENSLLKSFEENKLERSSSTKDKFMLGSDEQMAMLFSTTISSPAFTPTEENYDFIQAIKREQNSIDEFEKNETLCQARNFQKDNIIPDDDEDGEISPEDEREISQESDLSEQTRNVTIKSTIKVQDSIQIIEEEIKNLDFVRTSQDECDQIEDIQNSPEQTNGDSKPVDETDDSKQHYNIAENHFILSDKNSNDINNSNQILKVNSSTTNTIQSTMSESVEHTSNIIQDTNKTQVKKKKSKKSKKDHEKENISVCRSFGDLTTLPDDTNQKTSSNDHTPTEASSPDSRAKSMIDLRKLEEPLYRGVSVKALTSSFSKFDALTKKTVVHVRSSDAGKAQTKFNGSAALIEQQNCKACTKQVFQMEQIKAEKAIYHKNCFRCQECNKQLTVDTYQSHEATLYCKPHFKALFAPKVVVEDAPPTSDKPDLGLEELQSLNVKERFQVFEHANDQQTQQGRISPNVKRSPSILSKLAKFQARGMDIGVSDDALNGIPMGQSSDESETDEDLGEDADLIRAQRKTAVKEEPIVFDRLDDLKSRWEAGTQMSKDERRKECKEEIQSIRSRLFMGKQGKMKEMYQQAVMDSESGANVKKLIPATEITDTAKSIKERFEKGENNTKEDHKNMEEDMSIFEAGMGKKSRDLFKELDATSTKAPPLIPLTSTKSQSDIKRENSPDRDIYRDPEVVRAEETIEDPTVAAKTHTATKMLSIFRQLEEKNSHEQVPTGPKPLKCFTPPPEPARGESESEGDEEGSSEEEDEEHESETEQSSNVVRAVDKPTDEFLIQAQNAARAKQLRAKFEKWEENEIRREQRDNNQSSINLAEENSEEQIESARTLRARFESMRETTQVTTDSKPKVKVHRFV